MVEDTVLVGIAGSRNLSRRWRPLVTGVVQSLAKAGRGVAVGCAAGADAMGLRACFTDEGELRVPRLDVYAAFGEDGSGAWKCSAVKLVTRVAQHPKAVSDEGKEPPIKVSWWAGGAPPTPLVPRLKGRTAAMITAVDMSGDGTCPGRQGQVQGCGLIAFVTGGPERSCGSWNAIRMAVMKGMPVVVFVCGCSARCLPSLGDGHWESAGPGVWKRGWRWVPDEVEHVGAIEGVLSSILDWKKAPPRRRRTKLSFPTFHNIQRWNWETDGERHPGPTGQWDEVATSGYEQLPDVIADL